MEFQEKTCVTCARVYKQESDYLTNTSRWRVCDAGHLWFNCSCESTLLIPKGKFAWYSPEKTLSPEAASVFNKIPNIKALPHLPSSVMKLQQILSDPSATAAQIGKILRENAFLATDILKTANQMKSQRSQKIESLEHALTYVGFKVVADLATLAAFKRFEFKSNLFSSEEFWEHSLLNAKVAEIIAQKYTSALDPDQVFLAGSLCNVGKMVYAMCHPEAVDKVQAVVSNLDTQTDWRSVERANNIVDHSILGEIACALWGLPDFVRIACTEHHKPPTHEKPMTLADVVGLANQITHWIRLEPARIDNNLLNAHRENLKLDQRGLEHLILEISENLQ